MISGVSAGNHSSLRDSIATQPVSAEATGQVFDKLKFVVTEATESIQSQNYHVPVHASSGSIHHDQVPCGAYSTAPRSYYDHRTQTSHFVLEIGENREYQAVNLLLFAHEDDHEPTLRVPMVGSSQFYGNERPHTRFSLAVSGIPAGAIYAFEPVGDENLSQQARWIFDPEQFGIVNGRWITTPDLSAPRAPGRDDFIPPKSILMDERVLNPSVSAAPSLVTINNLAIYELHVKYTESRLNSELPIEFHDTQGTVKGLSAPWVFERLRGMGINTIEIMPLMSHISEWPLTAMGLENEWGYNPNSLVALDRRYFFDKSPDGAIAELKNFISEAHKNGFKVIFDCVWGHNSETRSKSSGPGPNIGPISSLMALGDNFHHRDTSGDLMDISGCGNTIDFNSPRAQALLLRAASVVLDGYEADGIRIDQCPVLGRASGSAKFNGENRPLQILGEFVEERKKFLTAEPTDCHGPEGIGYFHGEFPDTFAEQNLAARNQISHWLSGYTREYSTPMAQVLAGMLSRKALPASHRASQSSAKAPDIAMVDCHDGDPLWDRTKEAFANLQNSGILDGAYPEIVDDARREEFIRYKLAQASVAFLYLRPGPFLLRYNIETLASTNGDHNAYTNPGYLAAENPDATQPGAEIKLLFSRYLEDLARLRSEIPALNGASTSGDNVSFFNSEGIAVTPSQIGYSSVTTNPLVARRHQETQGRFLGALLGDINSSEESVYLAYMGTKSDFDLPKLPEGKIWIRIFDSQLSSPFEQVEIHNNYRVNIPGMIAFKAVTQQ